MVVHRVYGTDRILWGVEPLLDPIPPFPLRRMGRPPLEGRRFRREAKSRRSGPRRPKHGRCCGKHDARIGTLTNGTESINPLSLNCRCRPTRAAPGRPKNCVPGRPHSEVSYGPTSMCPRRGR